MRLICIKQGEWIGATTGKVTPGPKYFEEVTLKGVNSDGFYYLKEYRRFPTDLGYSPKWFIPLSEETEEIKELETELHTNNKN